MKLRVPSVPLIVNDPYFSIWSPSDKLYERHTENWTGDTKKLIGKIKIDNELYIFMGKDESLKCIEQKSIEIKPNSTVYTFANDKIEFRLSFLSHILLTNLDSVSEPFTYIKCDVKSLDRKNHNVEITINISAELCYNGHETKKVSSYSCARNGTNVSCMGRARQELLNSSGDSITIDWGYTYIGAKKDSNVKIYNDYNSANENTNALIMNFTFEKDDSQFAIIAYDDVLSIMYFNEAKKAYWARNGRTMLDVIEEAINKFDEYVKEAKEFDDALIKRAENLGDKEYAVICSLAYKQSICAHKLIEHKGEPIFLSKECDSNGCIGTVDISYPSMPLYLEYAPELVKGMMTPIFEFANMDVWEYDFAPHDVGRYPFATGQVYGLAESSIIDMNQGNTNPIIFELPKELEIFDIKYQMPIEECGNMIIMATMYYIYTKDKAYIEKNINNLSKWAKYLTEYGEDPNEQLCTDDFAGHLNHNVNLSMKAVVGIKLYSMLLEELEINALDSEKYKNISRDMAKSILIRARENNHTKLTFDKSNTWSLKYNSIWDNILGLNLFDDEFYKNEISKYLEEMNEYGVPLDNRSDYTKFDWIIWAATFTDSKEEFIKFVKPIYKFLEDTPNRVPFSDWVDTKTGSWIHFKNRAVVGGVFMPFVKETINDK